MVAIAILRAAAAHVDALAARLMALGVERIALVGGLAEHMQSWLSDGTRARLVPAAGDALDGALQLARAAAESAAA
jgi:glucosamine kinase